MAQKEATVYILDLGRSMGEKDHGRSKTNLEWAMDYVWDKITTTVSTALCSFGQQMTRRSGVHWSQDSIDGCDRFPHRWYDAPRTNWEMVH